MIRLDLHNTNKKCGKNTLILNITTALECPSKKLGLCAIQKVCYAKQAELRYHHRVLPYRKQQAKAWKVLRAQEITKQIVLNAIHRYTAIKYLRVSECGDFRNQKDIDKLSEIAHRLEKYGILVYTYTKRKDLDFNNISDNLIVNGSEFMLHNEFRVVDNYFEDNAKCVQNCAICNLCKGKNHLVIENKFHGVAFNYLKRRRNENQKS